MLTARVDRPTGPPPNREQTAVQDGPVHLVEAEVVHPEQLEALPGHRLVDGPVAAHLGEVPHPFEQAVGDTGRSPGPPGDLGRTSGVEADVQDRAGPADDGVEIAGAVVIEPGDEPEAVA